MFTLTIRTLRANKVRLSLTTFAVVLGVSFIVSSFVLGDGLRRNFTSLSEEIVGGVDAEVQPASSVGTPLPLDAELVDTVAAVDGVRSVAGYVEADGVQPNDADGEPITTAGPPLLGMAWIDDAALSSLTIVEGRAPASGLEFSIDRDAAADNGMVLGDSYQIATPEGPVEMTLVGISQFGADNATLGAVLTQYPLETAQEWFGREGQLDSIAVAFADEADAEVTLAAIQNALPDGADVVAQDQLLADTTADFTSGIDIFNNILLGFAVVALFVSTFIIANTFAIVLSQRTRELALLRAIGASPAQVQRSALLEALLVGVIASVLGIAGGIGLNYGLQTLFAAVGADLGDIDLVIAPRTIVVAMVVGVGVTVLSAIGPARRAARVAPIEALREGDRPSAEASRVRTMVGALVLAAGLAVGGVGLFASPGGVAPTLALLAGGAVATFIGVALTSPVVAGPIINLTGAPLRSMGVAGRLSTQNARRSPRRTSSTAASLMIGLALVTTALVLGESIKQSISETLAGEVRADFISSSDATIPDDLLDQLEASGEFDAVSGYRYDDVLVDGEGTTVVGADVVDTGRLFDLGVVAGELTDDPMQLTIHESRADALGVSVGDPLAITFPSGEVSTLTIAAVFENNTVIDVPIMVSSTGWDERFGDTASVWAATLLADDATDASAVATFDELAIEHPQVGFESQAEFQETVEGEIDQLLIVINAMLVLAITVALIGIANTMALSVHERTREIGLLRAVGMSRRQSRRMVRWEAAQVALFGSLLGVGVGSVFGVGLVSALPDWFVATLAFPLERIAVLVGVCALAGLVAATLPARRASKLDVLDAIGHA